jgi:hypothetical protein
VTHKKGAAMNGFVNEHFLLSELRSSDKDALVEHLNDRDIYARTFRIPFPYTDAAADDWLALVAKATKEQAVRFIGPFAPATMP